MNGKETIKEWIKRGVGSREGRKEGEDRMKEEIGPPKYIKSDKQGKCD